MSQIYQQSSIFFLIFPVPINIQVLPTVSADIRAEMRATNWRTGHYYIVFKRNWNILTHFIETSKHHVFCFSHRAFSYTSCFNQQKALTKIRGESLARGPRLLSIKNYVIEIMTWKFIYTHRERCKTGPAHNRWWNWSNFHIQAHLKVFLQILEYFSQSVDVDGLNLLAYRVFELLDCAGCIFVHFPLQ